tara:strand:- start:70 stop:441 length:372 start_codon:yes stop_codon:yes gene_type:complete
MKYLIALSILSACGVWAANAGGTVSTAAMHAAVEENSSEEKSGEEILARRSRRQRSPTYSRPAYTGVAPAIAGEAIGARSPIPAIILPNNVCVINTDLAPDRSIEEHILACIRAQQIRQSIQK